MYTEPAAGVKNSPHAEKDDWRTCHVFDDTALPFLVSVVLCLVVAIPQMY